MRFFVFCWKLETTRQTDCVDVEGDVVELIDGDISETRKLERTHDCPRLHRLFPALEDLDETSCLDVCGDWGG